jgi:hypothetical protein
MRADLLCGEERLRKLLPLAERLQSELADPLDFGCPCMLVDTDDGYGPALPRVIAQIDETYRRPVDHDLDLDLDLDLELELELDLDLDRPASPC